MSKLNVKRSICEHLKESSYNHNYYKLPFDIDGLDTILEIGDDDMTGEYFLGKGIFKKDEGINFGYDYDSALFQDTMHLDTDDKERT